MKNQSYIFISLILFVFGIALPSCSAVEEPEIILNKNGRRLPAGQRVPGILGVMSGMLLSQTVVR